MSIDRPTPCEAHRLEVIQLAGGPLRCALKDGKWGPCGGELEDDHVIEQARLKTLWRLANRSKRYRPHEPPHFARLRELETYDDLLADGRNGWFLCERHHNLKTRRLLRPWLRRDELPASVEDFAADFGVVGILDREYGQTIQEAM